MDDIKWTKEEILDLITSNFDGFIDAFQELALKGRVKVLNHTTLKSYESSYITRNKDSLQINISDEII